MLDQPTRILVVTDSSDADPELIEAVSRRSAFETVSFRLVVLNPARAELHLLHPERHDKAAEAEQTLRSTLPRLEAAAGARRLHQDLAHRLAHHGLPVHVVEHPATSAG